MRQEPNSERCDDTCIAHQKMVHDLRHVCAASPPGLIYNFSKHRLEDHSSTYPILNAMHVLNFHRSRLSDVKRQLCMR